MRFGVESWIWYTFALGIIIARLISRTLLFGSIKRLQYDDWIMGLFVTASYTTLLVMTNIEAKSHSNLVPPGFNVGDLDSKEISDRQYGSKIVIVVEQMQIAVIWACKVCLLILYHRLTRMVAGKENMAIKLLAGYVALGFVIMEILYFAAWCRPFHNYWAVPTYDSQCDALIDHRITNAVFNISSDLIMLCIALPMFIRSRLPWKRKIILCCIFSLGGFVILAAILNKYYSFTTPYTPNWIYWYVRESSTAILVANLPFTWTLLRRIFHLGAFDEHSPPPPTYHSARTAGGRRTQKKRDSHQSGATVTGGGRAPRIGHGMGTSGGSTLSSSLTGSATGTSSDSPATITSDRSDAAILHDAHLGVDDGDLERGTQPEMRQHHPETWDSAARHILLARPRRAVLAPDTASISSTIRSRVTNASHGGGGGGGRSATDRKKRAKMAKGS